MKVVGHRGAAGLASENSIASIKKARRVGVDAIEFDIRLSKDGKPYLCHDPTLIRTHDVDEYISSLTSKQISKIRGPKGDHIPSLEEALQTCGKTDVLIEAKGGGWAEVLASILLPHPNRKHFTVISFNHEELSKFGDLCPTVPLFVLELRNPFDAINAARIYRLDGIDVNYWTLNPLAYYLARRHNLKIAVFTVDKPWVAKLLRFLYKDILITTNYPDRLQFLRKGRK